MSATVVLGGRDWTACVTVQPLVFRWGHSQVGPVLERIAPLLTDDMLPQRTHLADKHRLAAASMCISVMHEFRATGLGVRYSTDNNYYSRPQRYRDGDDLFTRTYVLEAVRNLEDLGLVATHPGRWGGSDIVGKQAAITPTDKLSELIGDLVQGDEVRAVPEQLETVMLTEWIRASGAKKKRVFKDYCETPETQLMRAQAGRINWYLARQEVWVGDNQLPGDRGRRIFNGDFSRGGRFYFEGNSIQNCSRRDRGRAKLKIDGEIFDLVELDFKSMHASMAYAEMGLPIPEGDLYAIDGFDRDVVKQGFLIMLNAGTRAKAIQGLTDGIKDDRKLRELCAITDPWRTLSRPYAEKLVAAIELKHDPIKEMFNSDCGARFMRTDSDMAMAVMKSMIEKTGRCPLTIHDSFLVVEQDQETLRTTMIEEAKVRGLDLQVETK